MTVPVCTNAPRLLVESFPTRYGIKIKAVQVAAPDRGGWGHDAIWSAVYASWDWQACPRLLVVYEATDGDRAWWVLMGGVRGEVGYDLDNPGRAVGFAFDVPGVILHELYHALGCKEHNMDRCHEHLARIKRGGR